MGDDPTPTLAPSHSNLNVTPRPAPRSRRGDACNCKRFSPPPLYKTGGGSTIQ